MLAVVKEGPGPGFALRSVPEPTLQSGWVLIRVRAVGICGTDLPIFDGVRTVPYPLIPGHEFAGDIVAVADDVCDWRVGDRVAVALVIGCGHCIMCRQGQENLCPNIREIGIHINGAFAEYVAAPSSSLHRLPDTMSYIDGASIDPVASTYRGIRRLAPQPHEHVVILGAGPIALYALQAVRAAGVATLTVIARRGGLRTQIASALGADCIIESEREDPALRLAEITHGAMADLIIEATGNPDVLDLIPTFCRPQARVLLAGIFHHPATLHPTPIVRRELRIEGTFCYNWLDFALSRDLIASGRISSRQVVTHVLPLEAIGEGLTLLKHRAAVKVILTPP